jgi:predicted Fe-Mo cluster-binding NifX family protein
MKYKIAVSTTDGLTIYEHFGRTKVFRIYELEEDAWRELEMRAVPAPCREGEHHTADFDAVCGLLSDCAAIVVAKIGPGASDHLHQRGIRVFEVPGAVEKILGVIAAKKLLEKESNV